VFTSKYAIDSGLKKHLFCKQGLSDCFAFDIPEQFHALKNGKVDSCSNKTLHFKHSLIE